MSSLLQHIEGLISVKRQPLQNLGVQDPNAWKGAEYLKHPHHNGRIFDTLGVINQTLLPLHPEMHWPSRAIDESVQEAAKSTGCFLAASSTGKTAAIVRYLSQRFGLYVTCSHHSEVNALPHIVDMQCAELTRFLND